MACWVATRHFSVAVIIQFLIPNSCGENQYVCVVYVVCVCGVCHMYHAGAVCVLFVCTLCGVCVLCVCVLCVCV